MKKNKSLFLYSTLGILTVVSVGVSIWAIVKIKNDIDKTQRVMLIEDWESTPNGFKEFSQDNSFKVEMQISPTYVSQGTAWSWYIDEVQPNVIDWYLMTNFHVVNEAVAFKNDFTSLDENNTPYISNINGLLDYYSNNISTNVYSENDNYSFNVFKWTNSNKYTSFLSTTSYLTSINKQAIKSIDVITDFNNDNIDLFSNDSYNLDMSLIKVRMNLKDYSNNKYKILNVVDNYVNSSYKPITDNSKKTLIAGNPSESNRLIGVSLDSQKWDVRDVLLDHNSSEILNKLKAPYYYSEYPYSKFQLGPGASGSAVYQVDDNIFENDSDTNKEYFNSLAPIGIFWGGRSASNVNLFWPSFIPFIYKDRYNIFDNFIQYINNNI